MKLHFHDELVLCDECDRKAGYGNCVEVCYSNSGGYHPCWEGYKCPHVDVNQILAYYCKYANSKSLDEKVQSLLSANLTTVTEGKLIMLTADACRKLLEEV
jgi:hypothetical protein